jgi:hypothetical protein
MARAGQDDAEDEYVQRLHRLRGASDQEQVHVGGPAGRYGALRETAFTYAFMLWQMGLTPPSLTTPVDKMGAALAY